MKCTRCSSYKNEYGINRVPYSGNSNADYYFLGEMAGRHEAMASQKKPSHFLGVAGSNFDALLEMADINREEVAIANSHRCYKANNKKPTKSELDKCFIHTLREVNKIKPKLIIAMGEVALYQTLGKNNISKHRGKVYFSEKLNCNVYVVYHPASILYNSSRKDILIEDFKNIKHVGDPFQYYKADYTLIKSINEYEKIKNKLINSKIIYLDTETTGLDPWKDKITLIQLGTDNKEIYLFNSSILYDIDFSFLETKPIVGAGFEFDAKMLFTNLDISLDNYYHDVILAEYLLTGVGNNDLDELTDKYVPECSGYSEEAKNSGGAQNLSGEELYQYAANDIYVMYKIVEEQKKQLKDYDMINLLYNIKMPVNKVLTKMSILGVKYDVAKIKEVDKKYKKKGEDLLAIAKNLDGVEACQDYFKRIFNPRSSQQIKWLLLDYYKLPVLKTTKKTGNPSVGQKEMEIYAKKYNNKYCQTMVDYRSIQTLRSSFLKGVLPKLNDGIAHTKYSLHSTATGRPNSTGINLLNIPRNKDVKQCLIARDGYSFVYGDEAQMEVRIAAVIYNEPRLINICNDESKDMHCAITAQAFNRNYNEIYDGYQAGDKEITELRSRGKSVMFGILYQQQAEGLAYNINVKKQEAQQFIDDFYSGFPDLAYYIEETKKEVVKNGYLTNYFKFRRYWKNHTWNDHNTQREAVNLLIQSCSWNLLEIAMIKIDKIITKRRLKARLLMQVYDAIICESIDEEIDEVAHIMKKVMTSVNKSFDVLNRVKLLTDIEVGKNLSDMKKYKGAINE